MPIAPQRPCSYPGCARLVTKGRCAEHRSSERKRQDERSMQNPEQAAAKRIRSSSQWQAVARGYRATHPFCCDPFRHHDRGPELAHEIHHVTPLRAAPHLAFDVSNLRGLCRSCHFHVETMLRRGEPTTHLFPAEDAGEMQAFVY